MSCVVSEEAQATLGRMARHVLLRRGSRVAATSFVFAAMVAATAVTGSASGEPPAGTRITQVSIEHLDDDSTAIAVDFDGPITGQRWFRIDGNEPRAVLRIIGIVEAYRPYEVAVEDGRVRRVRIGHHPEFNPPEEHLVFDLVDDQVAISRVVKQDRRLVVILRKVEGSFGSRPPAPSKPTPTAVVPITEPATPTPTMTPTATAPPTPIPTVDPTATATIAPPTPPTSAPPTATPASPISPEQPRPAPTAPPTNPPQVAAPDRRGTATPQPPQGFSGRLLTELVISHREDGSALVRVTADGPIEGSDVSFFGVRVPPPRNILVIPGAGLPGEDALLPVRDGLLCEIGVEFIAEGAVRTELTFYLASSEVAFEKAAVKGAHAVILLRPPADPQAPLGCEVESRTRSRSWRFVATGPPQEAPDGAK
jgi:hypothetical protein